jgi:hypothetical protein
VAVAEVPATATAGWTGPPASAASFTISGQLNGVAATSASNAWAVGDTGIGTTHPRTLILRWNGTAWK